MLKTTVCVLALLASVPAAAGALLVDQSEIVRFDDLNLTNPAGVAKLERRVEAAVRRVCGFHAARGSSRIMPATVSTCMNKARASAHQDIALKTGATIRKG